jgi:hypothetical protein
LAAPPVVTLWARERIRDIEEGQQVGSRGSRQKRPKTESWKLEVIALAREFGLSSSLTSWIAIEEREEKDRQTGEIVLRKVPTLVTVGWHGMGSTAGGIAGMLQGGPAGIRMTTLPGTRNRALPGALASDDLDAVLMAGPARASRRDAARESSGHDRSALAPAAPPSPPAGIDALMKLLGLQRLEGGFLLDTRELLALGIDPKPVQEIAATALPGKRLEHLDVLHTAIVLELLESRFGDSRDTWFAAVRKSRTWLKRATAGWGRVIDGKTVTQWAKEVVAAVKPPVA